MLTIRKEQMDQLASQHPGGAVLPCELNWIEIELVGEDDLPIAGQRYRVVMPDGRVVEGTLDARGVARVEGTVAGQCEVTFPGLDEEAWESRV
ncbi:hypothetical protein [Pyxidicoccus trucidator]|uniref:hypothetical protein n=1 Tax=Pyxidicoccus trucidator TaxID=2709662 RepID=UPI0013DBDB49|nr:hypothetical protein [Pyxidicoccus trucidator]